MKHTIAARRGDEVEIQWLRDEGGPCFRVDTVSADAPDLLDARDLIREVAELLEALERDPYSTRSVNARRRLRAAIAKAEAR